MSYDAWLQAPHQDAMRAESDAGDFAQSDAERIEADLIGIAEEELKVSFLRDGEVSRAITALAELLARRRSDNDVIVTAWVRDQRQH